MNLNYTLKSKLSINLKMKISENKAVEQAVEVEAVRLTAQFDAIMKILDVAEREAQLLRLEIIDNILTLKCPRCKKAFLDYNGCCALTCGCGCGFCAYCLKDCGGDAHAHVPSCTEGEGIFCSEAQFNAVQNRRRQRLVKQRLQRESNTLQQRVKELLRKDLADLNIAV